MTDRPATPLLLPSKDHSKVVTIVLAPGVPAEIYEYLSPRIVATSGALDMTPSQSTSSPVKDGLNGGGDRPCNDDGLLDLLLLVLVSSAPVLQMSSSRKN